MHCIIHSILIWSCIILLRLTFTLSAVCDKCWKIIIIKIKVYSCPTLYEHMQHNILTMYYSWNNTLHSTTAEQNMLLIIKISYSTLRLCKKKCKKRGDFQFALTLSIHIFVRCTNSSWKAQFVLILCYFRNRSFWNISSNKQHTTHVLWGINRS